jgi:phage gpG-like protein
MAELKVDYQSNLNQVILQYHNRGAQIGAYMPAAAELLVSAVHDVVEAEGPGWEPLKEATLARRRKHGRDAKMLQDTGVALGTLDTAYGADFAEAVFGVPYMMPHVDGAPSINLPRRDPTDLGPFEGPLLDEVSKLLLDALTA